jgi:integrase
MFCSVVRQKSLLSVGNAMSRGRPQKPHHPSWGGDPIPGLYHCPDGRWRINATGQKFTEPDERRAVQKFLEWKSKNNPQTVLMPAPISAEAIHPMATVNGHGVPSFIAAAVQEAVAIDTAQAAEDAERGRMIPDADVMASYPIPEHVVWPWLRDQLVARPEYVARMIGIPEVAGLKYLALPRPALKVEAIIDNYRKHSPATSKGKERAEAIFRRLIEHSGAKSLDDLTHEALMAWRDAVESSKEITSGGTKQWMYGQVKAIIGFGLKTGMDSGQIRAALDRCKVLWTPDALPEMNPRPISREDFHKLLNAAGDGPWRGWLLVGLNFCLHMDEVCDLRTKYVNLEDKTYCCIRNKTRRERVPRAAVLWNETVDAIRSLQRTGPTFVFVSPHGDRYNVRSRCNLFKELREKAGLTDTITFDGIRDGAYTVACQSTIDDKWARVLAGQRAAGLQDNYVLRNPECARPACEAVYAAYGPF